MNPSLHHVPALTLLVRSQPQRYAGSALQRACARARVLLPLLALCLAGPTQAQYAISQVPMLVTSPPPPNIVLTVDDSGSMAWAYVPDSLGQYAGTAGFTASAYNALYYNPAIVYPVPPDASGQPVPQTQNYALTSFTHAYVDGFNPDQGWLDLSAAYTPTLSYRPGSSAPLSATGGTTGPAYYYVYTGGGTCSTPVASLAPPADTCFTQVLVSASSGPNASDERQNFANWYSFYRTRHLAIVSSAAIAMQDAGLASARVAWQALDSCKDDFTATNCRGWRGTSFDNQIRRFTGQHKTDFYNWLFQLPAANSTPTRVAWWRVGKYFSNSKLGANGPYGIDPNQTPTVTGSELLCVNNFNITLTDGLWNDNNQGANANLCGLDGSAVTCGNTDNNAITLPDGTSYVPAVTTSSTSIYSDLGSGGDTAISSGGLSDIAFYYWANNLRPDLKGFYVPPYFPDTSTNNLATGAPNDPSWPYWNPKNDPATWPHLVNFTVGVGLTSFLSLPGLAWTSAHDQTAGSAYRNLLSAASACPPASNCTWPAVDVAGNGNGNVYDLWHAAINSRGDAFSAESPQDLVAAMTAIISRIEGQTRGNSAAAGSSPSLTANTQLFIGSYDGADWHGTVTAYAVNPLTGAVSATPTWQTNPASFAAPAARAVFSAGSGLPAGGAAITVSPGIAFSAAGLGSTLLSYLGTTSAAQGTMLSYLLGDASGELRNGGAYRNRPISPLGDIVDSNPVYAYSEAFPNYDRLPESVGTNAYATYVAGKSATGRPAMVYAGANDGMLHGFDASTGSERLAYVPHSVIPNLTALANPNYLHAFSVDGPVFVGDAYFAQGSAAAAWHTVLVGTTGAGGRGVYALDVTSPQSFGAGSVLWDLDGSAAPYGNGDVNLGYTIGQPIIARLNNGDWAAVFGNGYLSGRSCAVLYIVRLADGLVRTLDTSGAASGSTGSCLNGAATNPNGLGSPTLLDLDQNGTTDYVFAGDLQGNLWKFDLTSSDPSKWGVAYQTASLKPAPLFTATTKGNTPQPIIAAPNLGPSLGNLNGYLVYFATGRLFASGDPADTTTQSIYAIQDQGAPITAPNRKTLVQQTVIAATDGSGNENIQAPYAAVDLTAADGWYIDLPGSGERALTEPLLAGGLLLFSTVVPQSQPCNGGCGGFVYAVNAFNGDGGTGFLVDPTTNKTYDALATVVGCVKGLTLINKGSTLNVYAAGNGGYPPSSVAVPSGTGGGAGGGGTGTGTGTGAGVPPSIWHIQGGLPVPGRISWHEVTQ